MEERARFLLKQINCTDLDKEGLPLVSEARKDKCFEVLGKWTKEYQRLFPEVKSAEGDFVTAMREFMADPANAKEITKMVAKTARSGTKKAETKGSSRPTTTASGLTSGTGAGSALNALVFEGQGLEAP